MRLALSVRTHHGLPCDDPIRKELLQTGGIIGRNTDSDLVLKDDKRIVSGRHAQISFQDGAFYLDDISSNGVFLNGSPEPVGRGRRVRLAHGDLLGIGDYVVTVEIESGGGPEPIPAEPPARGPSLLDPFAPAAPEFRIPDDVDFAPPGEDGSLGGAPPAAAPLLGKSEAVDPLELLGGSPPARRRELAPGAIQDHVPSEQVQFTPPRAVVESIPDDWDQTGHFKPPGRPTVPPLPQAAAPVATPSLPDDWDVDDAPTPAFSQPPVRPPALQAAVAGAQRPRPEPTSGAPTTTTADPTLEAFLTAAGFSPTKVGERSSDDLMRDAGTVLRELVAGLMELLAARSTFKSEFRIEATMIRPMENNPLKFSADAKEALEHLLIPSGKAYLPPGQAVREGVQDVKDHKLAMIAAMRAALESLLGRFDPDRLEARFGERAKKSSLMGLSGKGKNWEMYRELFAELRQDPDALFRDVFGEQFIRAYEAQIELLSRSRR
jgi:type VI secretion system protein